MQREFSCSVSERRLVWSSSALPDKSPWVTDWDLLMISSAQPTSISQSFPSIIACALWLSRLFLTFEADENWQHEFPKTAGSCRAWMGFWKWKRRWGIFHHHTHRFMGDMFRLFIRQTSRAALYTSSISSDPLFLTFPVSKTQTQDWEAVENSGGSSGFGCRAMTELVWAK